MGATCVGGAFLAVWKASKRALASAMSCFSRASMSCADCPFHMPANACSQPSHRQNYAYIPSVLELSSPRCAPFASDDTAIDSTLLHSIPAPQHRRQMPRGLWHTTLSLSSSKLVSPATTDWQLSSPWHVSGHSGLGPDSALFFFKKYLTSPSS